MINRFSKRDWGTLPIFISACYFTAYLGAIFPPTQWYIELNKAPWTPPNIAFPIVWSILYFFIAIVGWIIFRHGNRQIKALWCVQLFFNGLWSWLFFGENWPLISLIDLILLTILAIILTLKCWQNQLKLATLLLIPYSIWLCIATSLNTFIVIYN